MCGIAGIICAPNVSLADMQARLVAMARAMQHRGPDDEGTYVAPDGRVGLANRRLAIRDLSPAGHMPMGNADQTVWITYNGEIYNADALRLELEALGYAFHSTSDTEVLLKGYEAWGEAIVARLEGMFAFAIYDGRAEPKLFFARDPFGIKPLYYAFTAEYCVFASELKTLLASGLVDDVISPTSVMAYLRLGSVPNPLTIYQHISALAPAHAFSFALQRWQAPHSSAYWQLPSDLVTDKADHSPSVRDLLEQAVRCRLVSDVPL